MDKDWRLNKQEEYLSGATLYKVTFPEFWEVSLTTQNRFYKIIAQGPITYVKGPAGSWVRKEDEPLPILEAAAQWHEHCNFCWEKAMTNTPGTFYCTQDLRYWVCEECFHDFQQQFGWTEQPQDALIDLLSKVNP